MAPNGGIDFSKMQQLQQQQLEQQEKLMEFQQQKQFQDSTMEALSGIAKNDALKAIARNVSA